MPAAGHANGVTREDRWRNRLRMSQNGRDGPWDKRKCRYWRAIDIGKRIRFACGTTRLTNRGICRSNISHCHFGERKSSGKFTPAQNSFLQTNDYPRRSGDLVVSGLRPISYWLPYDLILLKYWDTETMPCHLPNAFYKLRESLSLLVYTASKFVFSTYSFLHLFELRN